MREQLDAAGTVNIKCDAAQLLFCLQCGEVGDLVYAPFSAFSMARGVDFGDFTHITHA